jgi:hypothetical protein
MTVLVFLKAVALGTAIGVVAEGVVGVVYGIYEDRCIRHQLKKKE